MSTPGKISKRAAVADPDADGDTPLKRARGDDDKRGKTLKTMKI